MDLEQWLNETPDPLVIDVEPIRMCSESVEIIDSEVRRIIEKTLDHLRATLPAMPVGRHIRLVTLRKLPGTIFLQSRATPWGMGAACLYRGLRNLLVSTLNANGIPAERVPQDIKEPESPRNLSSVLSVDIVAEDDAESTVVLAPPDAEIDEEAEEPPPGSLAFCERSEFHIYGTKWKNPSKAPSPPWKIPDVDFTKDDA
ncbi:hypothetical protein A3H22_01675 [Candidatus Peribacteria bacterium RIFCSPLOWO2_12_FULL_55_15]|nr:MAG: hypothetical protein A2789_02290 [Candidatus Peribacteria bacterium RIFCSPHIGHO2_01_FULL_54_22]OGJ62646.1 MAG: hypothetical protein A3D12_03720 [Candidatus Peribacteria bacterium RIFCSPHIGHO2_02_FULL_55_24]OGJ68371.1 MAG: hypothetical protein A2947_02560 [Candidatus Peribacteria bacterium RIFCSPLOWO2_01_FULL_54_110]OGJ70288.1 MAG: hypothetical protein A3H90_03505 [Candidatus Peribacteria bacterium RIFCSPLOWO2_02_FULL_55_36]OGJ72278.1 MAG: hypothetical protein A3H22_01675 [Candidatus Per